MEIENHPRQVCDRNTRNLTALIFRFFQMTIRNQFQLLYCLKELLLEITFHLSTLVKYCFVRQIYGTFSCSIHVFIVVLY